MRGSGMSDRMSRRETIGCVAGWAGVAWTGFPSCQDASSRKDGEPANSGAWTSISDEVLTRLAAEGKKPSWPGGTAGVSVDRTTGEVRMIVPDQGVWQRRPAAAPFVRVDGGR